MKIDFKIKLKAFLLLFIITTSSIGVPLSAHNCSHSNTYELSIFSSEEEDHCCGSSCTSSEIIESELSFNETPCCEIETFTLGNNEYVHTLENKVSIVNSNLFTLSFLSFIPERQTQVHKHTTNYYGLYGYEFRISIQSFLC